MKTYRPRYCYCGTTIQNGNRTNATSHHYFTNEYDTEVRIISPMCRDCESDAKLRIKKVRENEKTSQ